MGRNHLSVCASSLTLLAVLLCTLVALVPTPAAYAADETAVQAWSTAYKNGPKPYMGDQLFRDDSPHFLSVADSGNIVVAGTRGTLTYGKTGALLRGMEGGTAAESDESGNFYICRYREQQAPGHGYYYFGYTIEKWDSSGNRLWANNSVGYGSMVVPRGQCGAMDVVVNAWGNVCVAGYLTDHLVTVKCDVSGTEIWRRDFKQSGANFSHPRAIATDSMGNTYVTGISETTYLMPYTQQDFITLRYDGSGNLQWAGSYGSPTNNDDPAAVCVDASGNVYVTGTSYADGTDYDYATLKYDSNGNQLWVARYDGPASAHDEAKAIVVDSSGNAYVTGTSAGNGGSQDYATVKYDSNGNQLWVARYDGPGSGDDSANALALDSSGNVYVTGGSEYYGGLSDYATVKYDNNGNHLWVQRYHAPDTEGNMGTAVAVDAGGSVYVTGGTSDWETYTTLRYIQEGGSAWPDASFSATPLQGVPPLMVQFTDDSMGDITAWAWNFGDGQTSNEQNPSHIYASAGTYGVSLNASCGAVGDTETKSDYVFLLDALAWQFVPPDEDTVVETSGGQIVLDFPAGAVSEKTEVIVREESILSYPIAFPRSLRFADTCFSVNGVDTLSVPTTIAVRYTDTDVVHANGDPEDLVLCYYDGDAGEWQAAMTIVNSTDGTLQTTTSRMGAWAIFAKVHSSDQWLPPWAWICIAGGTAVGAGFLGYVLFRRLAKR